MAYDYEIKGTLNISFTDYTPVEPYDLVADFRTSAEDFPGLCGDAYQRRYLGQFLYSPVWTDVTQDKASGTWYPQTYYTYTANVFHNQKLWRSSYYSNIGHEPGTDSWWSEVESLGAWSSTTYYQYQFPGWPPLVSHAGKWWVLATPLYIGVPGVEPGHDIENEGHVLIKMNSTYGPTEIGFKEFEKIYGWLDLANPEVVEGKEVVYFKIKVPWDGLALERAFVAWGSIHSGLRFGVRLGCEMLGFTIKTKDNVVCWVTSVDGFWKVIFAVRGSDGWEAAGQFGCALFPERMWQPVPLPNGVLYTSTYQHHHDPSGPGHYTAQVETWDENTHNVEQTGINAEVLFIKSHWTEHHGGYWTEPVYYTVYYGNTPFSTIPGFSGSFQGVATYDGSRLWNGSVFVEIPQQLMYKNFTFSINDLKIYEMVSMPDPYVGLHTSLKATIYPSAIGSGCNLWERTGSSISSGLAPIHAWYQEDITPPGGDVTYAEEASNHHFGVINLLTGEVLCSMQWGDPSEQMPTHDGCEFSSGAVLCDGIGYVFTREIATGRTVLINIASGGKYYFRDVYTFGDCPNGDGIESAATTFGVLVPYGKLLVINPTPPEYSYVAMCEIEDLSDGCAENYHRARATFTIRWKPDDDYLYDATVTVKCTFGVVGQEPFHEEFFTLSTVGLGQVIATMPSCILREFGMECELKFCVTNVVKGDLIYIESKNVCTCVQIDLPELPWDCDYDNHPISPNPAAFMSSSPFQQRMSSVYYHIMVAQTASHEKTGCVEYKFTCLDDDSLSSDWRSTESVAGTFYPNGTGQVPQQYWAAVSGKNLLYEWTVQYRACVCENGDTASAPKQVPTLP